MSSLTRPLILHLAVIAALAALELMLPVYHQGVFARILVLAVYAMGYNLLFGYTGLLSLGHAMFFSAGLYGAGLTVYHLGWSVPLAFGAGLGCGLVLVLIIGLLALRTSGVSFMIVTMMFAQVFYLATLYFGQYTRGDEGVTLPSATRIIRLGDMSFDLTSPATRYYFALMLFSVVLLITLAIVRSRFGRVLVAIRENEERTKLLGYNTFANKLSAVIVSGLIASSAGAAYALLFGYVGSTFATVQYSILPLLWVLLGGPATTLGPLLGTILMYYMVDYSSGLLAQRFPEWNFSYLGVVGIALIVLVLFFPKGILGFIRDRWVRWLP